MDCYIMAIYMIITWVPFDKIKEVDEIMISRGETPFTIPNIKKWTILSTPDGQKGMKTYNIIYIEENKAEETLIHLMKLLSHFNEIKGYSYKIESVLSGRDMRKLAELEI